MPSPRAKPWLKIRTANRNKTTVYENVANVEIKPVLGYYGFKLYFPVLEESEREATLKRVKAFENFVQSNVAAYSFQEIQKNKCFFVDYNTIRNDANLNADWPDFKEELVQNTDHCLDCMSLAMHQCLMQQLEEQHCKNEEQINVYSVHISSIRARLYNYEPVLSIKDLKTNCFGRLVCVRGTVVKARNKRLQCQYMAFQCSTCGGNIITKQTAGNFLSPPRCSTENCKAKFNFKPLLSSPHTRTIDWQSVKLQELMSDTQAQSGRIPRTYDCELTGDLLNTCAPGDDVVIMGVVKRRISEKNVDQKQAALFEFYLDVVSVINSKNEGQAGQINFKTTDYYAIQKIHEEPAFFRLLVNSLCPSIYGNEIVKAGLLLALFGGTRSDDFNTRSRSHVLMVGDPGLGKSQMLQACTNVAPRGVYVCGKASTSSGLTVTVTRDSGGESALEAGALVLADQGCCCIDEFDKMSAQHECLLEAMEQQSVSIAKAGIICTLPTRTAVLAAANPVDGHYNKGKTIAENLAIRAALLSRFDLVFILLDKPDAEIDKMLPKHVLRVHMGAQYRTKSVKITGSAGSVTEPTTLRERLKLQPDEHIDHLPHVLFRKYIAYAQRYVKPQLSDKAKAVLKEFYFELRSRYKSGDLTPVTVRQLHSLIRLTQARAKLELREEATRQDAEDVVEITRECLVDVSADEPLETRKSVKSTTRNQMNALLDVLREKAEERNSPSFSTRELKCCCETVGICSSKIRTTLDTLNIQGFLLNKGQGNYQLVASSLI